MKLPSTNLNLASQLAEFDTWIIPSLGEIQDTERFQEAMNYIVDIFNSLASATNNFASIEDFSPTTIADSFINLIKDKTEIEARVKLESLAAVLFLVTGKTDNNSKCQLPLYLRDEAGWENIPSVKRNKKTTNLEFKSLPRVLKTEAYMQTVASLAVYKEQQKKLLEEFIKFVLKDNSCISQLWSIGYSYCVLKKLHKERDLLAPLVIFQIRGSVSASAGHRPETLLRERLEEWGLERDVDFNTTDVVIGADATKVSVEEVENTDEREETISALVGDGKKVEAEKIKNKTRAYDFVLPFKTPGWKPTEPKIFIQCQFYAGDSGSVSHKNLDQTDTSRQYILSFKPNARFIEYVDGAGYYSSLNGDLKKLLSKPTTASFFQVRSAVIRLRRELQQIGFLIPLALEQTIVCSDGNLTNIQRLITQDGYSESEFNRCLKNCIERNLIIYSNNKLSLIEHRKALVRRYFILDIVAMYGEAANRKSELTASIIIPGYGQFYGMKLTRLISEARSLAPGLNKDWSNPEDIMKDIEWLCEERLAMLY